MTDPEAKWSCEYCTYKNFPSSLKCTMCRGPKPLLNEDIYRLHGTDSPVEREINTNLSGIASGGVETRSTGGKWSCEACTYLNLAVHQQCTQCGSPKVQDRIQGGTITESTLHEHMGPLRISATGVGVGVGVGELAQSAAAGHTSHTNMENSRRSQHKWTCAVCTYENWPKSVKCAMCGTTANNATRSQAGGIILSSPERESNQQSNDDDWQTHSHKYTIDTGGGVCRQQRRQADWAWLNACLGVLEGDAHPVEAYLSSGGDPARQLTPSEVSILNRSSAFDAGHTLVHLAIRFQRDDMLASLLSQIEGSGSGLKRVPSYVAPDIATDIRRHYTTTVRQRKGSFPCNFVTELPTFALPAEIEELPGTVQEQLFNELLDKEAQQQLESEEAAVVNWCLEVTVRLGSRLYALWNRSAGDCLLDSAMQATWGVFDRDNTLRTALAHTLHQAGHVFYPRWKEYESSQASLLQFSLEEAQWAADWAGLVRVAGAPGASLQQLHVFALAHILRRPIIVYGVKYVHSFRGEALGYARFQGVYLPLLWEQTFCIRTPLALGYTRGHFSALVPMEPEAHPQDSHPQDNLQITFLPLMDRERKLLPVHFLTQVEVGREEALLREWLDVCETEGGVLVAQQRLHKRPLLVAQLLEEWLNHYRRLAQMTSAPFARPLPIQDYSSDGDTDDE